MVHHKANTGRAYLFRLRPRWGFLIAAVFVLVAGGLGALQLMESVRYGDLDAGNQGRLVWAGTIVVSGLLFIISTSRMWFTHLWHRRR